MLIPARVKVSFIIPAPQKRAEGIKNAAIKAYRSLLGKISLNTKNNFQLPKKDKSDINKVVTKYELKESKLIGDNNFTINHSSAPFE